MPFRLGCSKQDVKDALTSQGYTTTRAAKLDKLNTTVGSRATSGLTGFTSANARMVWNVNVASAGIAGSYGLLLESKIDTTISSRAKSGLAIPVSLTTAGARVVWSVTVASANVAGTFGSKNQRSVQSGLTVQGFTTAVSGRINTALGTMDTNVRTHVRSALTLQGLTTAVTGRLTTKLDTTVSSRATPASAASITSAATISIAKKVWNLFTTSAGSNASSYGYKLRTNLNTTISSRFGGASGITHIQTAMTNQGYTTARAAFLNTTIGSRAKSGLSVTISTAGARVVWGVTVASANVAGTFGSKNQKSVQSGLTAQGFTTAVSGRINTSLGTVDTNVRTHVRSGLTLQGLTTAVTGRLTTKLDTTVSSRAVTGAAMSLNASGMTHVQTAMTNQGYTSARAAFLNTTIGSRAIETSVIIHVKSALTSYGYTSAVAAHLNTTIGSRATSGLSVTIGTLTTAAARVVWKVTVASATTVGTFGEKLQKSVHTALTTRGYTSALATKLNSNVTYLTASNNTRWAYLTTGVKLRASGITNVQTALTNQGYTTTRAAYLNTTIGSRAKSGLSVSLSTAGARVVWSVTVASANVAGTFGSKNQKSVQSGLTAQGFTTALSTKLNTNVNTTIGSRAIAGAAMSLNASGMTHVQTAMTNQGYTTARAAFLNTSIGSRAIESQVIIHVKSALTSYGYSSALAVQLLKVANPASASVTKTAASNVAGVALNLDAGYRSVLELRYTLSASALASVMSVEGSDTSTGGTWYVGDTWTEVSAATNKIVGYMTARRYNRVRTTKTGVGVTFELVALL